MNDGEIRKVLISFLKARYDKIRIYQEKAIGGAICDLMTVTECLTGYEIKSDLDNYTRLESQVSNYQKFFNENYIVVGKAHEHSAVYKVPESWGIIVVGDDNVLVSRKAKPNNLMQIKNQISILWRLELNNLLS